ncbi:WD40 repeat domain-containing protein [Paenibacillus sp. KQZ6P-2]|uniref:WD40 repeat domain-containing protein n=1 Tax=Paenibacillus mangrovi TaxID=2931978 RepID=A0A9X1WSA1_9BACL|nr:WD40 repeat domain-containing protein [Paenibacillus mangrovi]MCJ8013701.1 WD40 repeat domain-containing protein [Paenibacillus mangrovi]
MVNKRFVALPVLFTVLIILLSGCARGLQSETIVIPSTEDEHIVDSGSKPFQVKTIYRLPISETNDSQLLGWTDPESVVGLFQDDPGATRHLTQSLQRLKPPYEQLEKMQSMNVDPRNIEMSPNGKYIVGFNKTQDGMKLISLSDGRETTIGIFKPSEGLLKTKLTWSDNSRYISYLITDVNAGSEVKMAVYDTTAGQVNLYPLKCLQNSSSISEAKMSDDGQSVLIVVRNKRTNSICMGTVDGSSVNIEYEHQTGGDQMAWLNKDQFVFLGTEGTLYEYDRRNKALSVLLEKVLSFQLSQDRKYIAYSQQDNDSISIYAGKLQGNNVLYKTSVYQGFLPSEMFWSLDNDSLLINGQKIYSAPRVQASKEPGPVSYNQPFIIKFQ